MKAIHISKIKDIRRDDTEQTWRVAFKDKTTLLVDTFVLISNDKKVIYNNNGETVTKLIV